MGKNHFRKLAQTWAGVLALMIWAACASAAVTPKTVHVLDARRWRGLNINEAANVAEAWDTMHALAALQGIVNRESPRFYLRYCTEFGVETDQFWLVWFRGEDGWLREAEIIPLTSLEQAVVTFRKQIKGLVVYDPAVPPTACLASTAAGCDDLLPVRFSTETNSVFALLAN